MIDLAKEFLEEHNQKIGISASLQDWMKKHNLTL
jgi:hypothetical protein